MSIASMKANPAMKPSAVGLVRELFDKILLAVTASPARAFQNRLNHSSVKQIIFHFTVLTAKPENNLRTTLNTLSSQTQGTLFLNTLHGKIPHKAKVETAYKTSPSHDSQVFFPRKHGTVKDYMIAFRT